MLLRTKKTLICVLVLLCAMLFAAVGAVSYTQNVKTAYAYTNNGLPTGDNGNTAVYSSPKLAAAASSTCEFSSNWKSTVTDSSNLTEITFAKTAPDGYSDSGKTLNTDIKIYTKDGDNTKIAFVYDGTITAPLNSSSLFYNLQNLTAINFDNFSTDNVKNMRSMFSGCSALTSLGLSDFNAASVTDMGYMFRGCSALTSLDLSGFNTVKVENMSTMFQDCIALTSLDLSGFNTTNVKNMSYMFGGCNKLQGTFGINGTGIKISDLFTTDNVTSMSDMFYDCIGLTSLDLSGFNTASVESMSGMFYGCIGLQGTFGINGTAIKISGTFTTDNVTSMSNMFYGCAQLTLLDLSCLNTAKVEYMNYMFYYCIGLTSLDLSGFNTASVESMSGMFYGCIGLQGTFGINGTAIKISGTFTTDNVTSMSFMFGSCTGLASIDLSGLKTANVTNMSYMFYVCKGLTSLDLSDFNAASVTNMTYMFNTCTNLKTITVSDSLAKKLNTTDDTYLYSGVRKTLYDGNGGTYTDDTNDNKFSKGGTYTTVQPPFEVMAGDKKYYNTLAAAWNYANTQSSATVKMNADATVGETLTVNSGVNITLDLNGYKITYTGTSGSVITVNGTFTLEDNKNNSNYNPDHSHTITSPVTNKEATINGGLITGGKGSGSSVLGGAIYVAGGYFTMNGGTLAGNTAIGGHGGAIRNGGTFTMAGGTITHNKSGCGGGVCVCDGNFVMTDGEISYNESTDDGGGVFYENDAEGKKFVLSGGEISNNIAVSVGGGVHLYTGVMEMSGGTVSGNYVTGQALTNNGGGVYVNANAISFKVSGGATVSDNYQGGERDESTGLYTDGTKNNVFLASGKTITVENALTTGAISVYNSGEIATGYAQSEKPSVFFKADDSANCASSSNGTVSIGTHTGGTATCVAAKTCTNCGESYGSVDSTNHTPSADDGDCTTAITCSACGAVTTAAQTHDFSGGYLSDNTQHWHVCKHSGCTQTDTKKNHNCNLMSANPIYYAAGPTCTQGASYYYSCVCGAAGTETFMTVGALNHDFVGSTVYVSDGTQHWKKCSRCDEEDKDNAEDCSGGTATCVAKATCLTCNNEYGSENSSNHDPATAWSVDAENGKHYHVCNNGCGNRVDEASHTPEADDNDCTTEIKCSVCQAVTTAAQTHDFSGGYLSDNTQHWHVCTHSGCNITDTKTDHNCNQEVATDTYLKSVATCTAKAVYYKSCVCGFAGTETFENGELTAHTEVDIPAVAATCTETGLTAGKKCSVCQTITVAQQTVEKTAHTYGDWETTQEPTCSAIGNKKKTCGVCGDIVTEKIAIDENAHSWNDGVVTTQPTCTTAGVKTFTCTHNSEHTTTASVAIDPTAHSYGEWVNEVSATCIATGTTAHKDCLLCHKHFDSNNAEIADLTIAIDSNAHSYDTTKWTTDGTGHWHAATCGHDVKKDYAEHSGGTASCTEKATCSECQEKYGNFVSHDFANSTTYKSDGTQHWKQCANCTAEDTDNKVNHNGTATCTEKAKCSVCQAEYGEVLGHDWDEGEITTPATCKTKGEKTFNCKRSDCTETKTEEIEIDDTAHSYASAWTKDESGHWHAATCEHTTEKGSFATHTAGEWIVTPAQVGIAGSRHKECTVCGYNMQTEVIEPLTDTLVEPGSNGEENKVVVTTPEGFTPDIELVVTEIEKGNYGSYEAIANTVNGEINLVYDVTLKSDGVTIQPDGTLTIKLRIPENLVGKNFKLFHLHGSEATDMEYTVDGNYAVVNTDKLSEFIFVGEKTAVAPTPDGFNPLWLILIIIVSLVIVGEVGYIVYRKVRKNKAGEVQE